jgi:hypothetical protein
MTKHVRDLTIEEIDMILSGLDAQRRKYVALKEIEEEELHIGLIEVLKTSDIMIKENVG